MNRTQRRAAKKAAPKQPAWKKLTVEERKAALIKNGISVSDLEKAGKDAYKRGYDDGVTTTYKSIYAALCLALNETMGFGKKRLRDVLQKTDQIVLEQLTSMEAIEEVWNKIGLQLVFDDPFERVQEK